MNLGDLLDILALINNGINFLLYCTMSKQFRDRFAHLFIPSSSSSARRSPAPPAFVQWPSVPGRRIATAAAAPAVEPLQTDLLCGRGSASSNRRSQASSDSSSGRIFCRPCCSSCLPDRRLTSSIQLLGGSRGGESRRRSNCRITEL